MAKLITLFLTVCCAAACFGQDEATTDPSIIFSGSTSGPTSGPEITVSTVTPAVSITTINPRTCGWCGDGSPIGQVLCLLRDLLGNPLSMVGNPAGLVDKAVNLLGNSGSNQANCVACDDGSTLGNLMCPLEQILNGGGLSLATCASCNDGSLLGGLICRLKSLLGPLIPGGNNPADCLKCGNGGIVNSLMCTLTGGGGSTSVATVTPSGPSSGTCCWCGDGSLLGQLVCMIRELLGPIGILGKAGSSQASCVSCNDGSILGGIVCLLEQTLNGGGLSSMTCAFCDNGNPLGRLMCFLKSIYGPLLPGGNNDSDCLKCGSPGIVNNLLCTLTGGGGRTPTTTKAPCTGMFCGMFPFGK